MNTLTNSASISPNIKWETKWPLKYLPTPRFTFVPQDNTKEYKIYTVIQFINLVLSNTSLYLFFKRKTKYKTIKIILKIIYKLFQSMILNTDLSIDMCHKES